MKWWRSDRLSSAMSSSREAHYTTAVNTCVVLDVWPLSCLHFSFSKDRQCFALCVAGSSVCRLHRPVKRALPSLMDFVIVKDLWIENQNNKGKYFEKLFLLTSSPLSTVFSVFHCFDGFLSLIYGSVLTRVSLSLSVMMCLSDANEWYLQSSVFSLPFSFSSSLHLPAWSERLEKEIFLLQS